MTGGSEQHRVGVITDSTACLPVELAAQLGTPVVPLQMTYGDRTGEEGIDVSADDVAKCLLDGAVVTTSRPAPERFATAIRDALDAGLRALVVVTMSSKLSGTYESARTASTGMRNVRCVDSGTTAMGLGFAVLAAARVAAEGADLEEVAGVAYAAAAETRTYFCVNSLDYLRRGGRIGAVRALVGTALAVKPILHIDDGQIALCDKVRTTSRARARLIDLAVEAAAGRPVDVAVHYVCVDGEPTELTDELRARLPTMRDIVVSQLGPAVTAHVGPGVVGVVVSPA